jgi:hypothetical protein
VAFYGAFWGEAYWNQSFQVARSGSTPPPFVTASGPQPQVGWGTGRRHGVSGQRHDDIKIERRERKRFTKLEIQERDDYAIMLFVKTFRQFSE